MLCNQNQIPKMKIDVLLGLQWGDEGKGKVVDVLTNNYDIIARFQGGPNAGHSLEFNGIKHILHTIPSGIFHNNAVNVIGNGVVIDPVVFKREIENINKLGIDATKKLVISRKAHIILPTHRILDGANEAAKGKDKIGSTLKGIGPTYTDKISRNGMRVGDLLKEDFEAIYKKKIDRHLRMLSTFDFEFDLAEFEKDFFEGIEIIKSCTIDDTEFYINEAITENKKILAEGAQGTLLDIDFGSYPFVTSSNTMCAGTCTGLGIAPQKIGDVIGIFKAYCTRVGSGPFPTELEDQVGQNLRDYGHEYGSTTGRPRRCGWMDLVALKYVVMLNGVTQLIMTKADVLDSFESIKIATKYRVNGEITDRFPFDIETNIEPIYEEFKGWSAKTTEMRTYDELPQAFKDYMKFIEDEIGVPIKYVSVGPDREQIITI